MSYPFKEIEPKWQAKWEQAHCFEAVNHSKKPKYYVLDMFPYPSSHGLHVGHVEGYTASDIVARYKRAQGFNVLHPIGWDAFGLPAEQYAIQTGIHPEQTTQKAIANFTKQLKSLGFSYDWTREISTCDPKYYKWTQWIFLHLFERGLAYEKEVAVNWCPALKTVLANEEVVDGKSERGGHPVERRPMRQWMLKITAYADELLRDLDDLDWPERTKEAQRNWIGRSVGLQASFTVDGSSETIEFFTTRPDTIFGVTFMVLAPEHPLVLKLTTPDRKEAVQRYLEKANSKSDIDRQAATEKTGEFIGAYAVNPLTNEKVPVWVADYVLMDYGSGAVMAVPGHDERDFEFATKFNLPIKRVIEGDDLPYAGDGKLVNSGPLDGLDKEAAIEKAIALFVERGLGKAKTQYRLRDWLFARQRYWGEPFPIVHFPKAGLKGVDPDSLPVLLPKVSSFEPDETGAPPLNRADASWLKATDPETGEEGTRETNTMPGYAGSSWYFLRYADPHNEQELCSKEAESYWLPVDLYLGGAEHTVGHLLYARFWQKVLHDAGVVSNREPFKKLVHQGMILGEDGEKMSKSRGNVVNPDDVIAAHGADALRTYEMFMGPIDKDKPWSGQGMTGITKFLNKVWNMVVDADGNLDIADKKVSNNTLKLLHQTIAKVTHDLEALAFNTAISQMMILTNEVTKAQENTREVVEPLLKILQPFAPHIAEELWSKLGNQGLISTAPWPSFDEALAKKDRITLAVQVSGKVRATIEIDADADQATVEQAAKSNDNVIKYLSLGEIIKTVFVPGRIINFIVKPKS